MPPAKTPPQTPPPAVWIVAMVLAFSAAWQLMTRVVPSFVAGDPEAFSQVIGVLQQPELAATVAADGYDTAALGRLLTVLGALAALSVILPRTASAKRAFGIGRRALH